MTNVCPNFGASVSTHNRERIKIKENEPKCKNNFRFSVYLKLLEHYKLQVSNKSPQIVNRLTEYRDRVKRLADCLGAEIIGQLIHSNPNKKKKIKSNQTDSDF